MARKSSKTARVMNLLANGEAADPEVTKEEAAEVNRDATEAAEAPQSIKELTVLAQKASVQSQDSGLSPISIIDMSASAPDPVAELIKEKLEEEEPEQIESLTVPHSSQDTDEQRKAAPAQTEGAEPEGGNAMASEDNSPEEETYIQEEGPKPREDIITETGDTDTSAEDAANDGSTVPEDPDSAAGSMDDEDSAAASDASDPDGAAPITDGSPNSFPAEEPPAAQARSLQESPVDAAFEAAASVNTDPENAEPEKPHIEEYQYLNVMERLVKERVIEYMNKFDVCTCDRCVADTTALTLTHLPPKYLVVHPSTAAPLLNFYSNKFSQQVIVELTKACTIVKANPHH